MEQLPSRIPKRRTTADMAWTRRSGRSMPRWASHLRAGEERECRRRLIGLIQEVDRSQQQKLDAAKCAPRVQLHQTVVKRPSPGGRSSKKASASRDPVRYPQKFYPPWDLSQRHLPWAHTATIGARAVSASEWGIGVSWRRGLITRPWIGVSIRAAGHRRRVGG